MRPSQNGGVRVRLQPHSAYSAFVSIASLRSVRPVPLCEPSQNGWFSERPQAHYQ